MCIHSDSSSESVHSYINGIHGKFISAAHKQEDSDHQRWFAVLTRCCLQPSSVETTTATLSCVRFYCKALQSAHRHDNVNKEGGRESFANTLSGYEKRTTFYKVSVCVRVCVGYRVSMVCVTVECGLWCGYL